MGRPVRDGLYVEIRCSASKGKCRHIIAKIADSPDGPVVKDGQSSFAVFLPWYFVRGCPVHKPVPKQSTAEIAYRDDVIIPWDVIGSAYKASSTNDRVETVSLHPDDMAAFRKKYGQSAWS